MEYDLICQGLRLRWVGDGSDRISWRDLMVIVRHSQHGTAVGRKLYGESADWGVGEHLLAGIFDLLQGANWQRSGGKSGDKPKPLERPDGGDVVEHRPVEDGQPGLFSDKSFEPESMTLDEINSWLGIDSAGVDRRESVSVGG